MSDLKQMIESALKDNPRLTVAKFAASQGVCVATLSKRIKSAYGLNWSQIKASLISKNVIASRGDRTLKLLQELACSRPDVKRLRQAAELIGESHEYVRGLLCYRNLSWGRVRGKPQPKKVSNKDFSTNTKITIPSELLMPIRAYRHCQKVYSNTDARI